MTVGLEYGGLAVIATILPLLWIATLPPAGVMIWGAITYNVGHL